MGWRIDRDYINDRDEGYKVGVHLGTLEGETFRFRLLDDDGNVYYGGVYDAAATECADSEETEDLYDALAWARHDAGAVDLEVKVSDGIRHGLTSTHYAYDVLGKAEGDWVSVYG